MSSPSSGGSISFNELEEDFSSAEPPPLTLLDEDLCFESAFDEDETSFALDNSLLKLDLSGPLEESSPHPTRNAASKTENKSWEHSARPLKAF
jgi:hypothetical protein